MQSSKTKSVCVHVCVDFHEMVIASVHSQFITCSNDTGMWLGHSPEEGQRCKILRTDNAPILCIGNEGVPKIIVNGTVNLFFKCNELFVNFKQ